MEPIDPRVDPSLVADGSRPVVLAEHSDTYKPLPSIRTPAGFVITRWRLTEEERAALVSGQDLFITVLAEGAICPLLPSVGPLDWTWNGKA